jgi:hypothetical protein
MKPFFLVLLLACLAFPQVQNPYYREIKNKKFELNKITYIPLDEGMRYLHSCWGGIGYAREGFVYVLVCDHITNAGIFEYQTKADKLFYLGDVKTHLALPRHADRQPKIHTPLIQYEKDGLVYFGTDAGDRSLDVFDHADEGYRGGVLAAINPVTKELKNLGLFMPHGGYKCLAIDQERGYVYTNISAPSAYFVKYDIGNAKFDLLGRVHEFEVPRVLFLDKWNNVYNTGTAGNLVRYNVEKDTLEYLNVRMMPGETGPGQVAYGPDRDWIIGIDGYSGDIRKYTPEKDGPGRVDSVANIFGGQRKYMRNLNMAGNKLYMVVADREASEVKEVKKTRAKPTLYIFDLEKRVVEKKIPMDDRAQMAFSHGVSDADGNLYVVGFLDTPDMARPGKVSDRVFLIKFNPKDL